MLALAWTMLSGVNLGSPWALNHAEGASNLLESALGSIGVC